MDRLGSNIRALREKKELTQNELAKILGVTEGAVSSWEHGRNTPRMGIIQKMSVIFGVQTTDIIDGDSEKLSKLKDTPEMQKAIELFNKIPPSDQAWALGVLEGMLQARGLLDK
jgi:transcriptional regulator with XRE-family HTH domain